MRRWIFTFVATIAFTVSANALSYTQARTEALFLTDKMAYELGLNTIQQELVYEVNLDYLLTISGTSGYYSIYWDRRNSDLRYINSIKENLLLRAVSINEIDLSAEFIVPII